VLAPTTSHNSTVPQDASLIDPSQNLDEHTIRLNEDPLCKRNFTLIAQTSTAIQVAWSHPSNLEKG